MPEKTNSILSRMLSAVAVVMIAALAVSVAKAEEPPALPPITANGGASLHGKFVWSDLVTSSFEDARDFYVELLDLEWRLHSETPVRYGVFMRDGRPVAGLAERAAGEEDATAHWVHYVSVADVAKAQLAASSAGGRALVASEELPDRGDIAIIEAPDGAVVGLMKSSAGDPPDFEAEFGEWLWREWMTRDGRSAAQFYRAICPSCDISVDENGRRAQIGSQGYLRAGISAMEESPDDSDGVWIGFLRVADLDEALGKAERVGARVLVASQDIPGGRMAVVEDTAGAPLGLMQWSDTAEVTP